ERLHASLALLPVDPGQVTYLEQQLLEVEPDEALVIARLLDKTEQDRDVVSWLRARLRETERQPPDRRFRAACALARLDPRNYREEWSDEVARRLVKEPEASALKWALLLRSVRFTILQSVEKIVVEPGRPESERSLAAVLVLRMFSGMNEVPLQRQLAFTLEAEGEPYATLSSIVMAGGPDTEA